MCTEIVRSLGKLDAGESVPILLGLLTDDELYGPRAGVYHAITDVFQTFAGIDVEIQNAFPGKYPAMFSVGGAPVHIAATWAHDTRKKSISYRNRFGM